MSVPVSRPGTFASASVRVFMVLRVEPARILLLAGCVLLLCSSAVGKVAQLPSPPLPIDPTPLPALLSHHDKAMLQQARGPRRVVETYLDISDTHLDAAEKASGNSDFPLAEHELDVYNKALTQASTVAFSQESGKRDLGKKIEQRIYRQLRTLESIQRRFPLERMAFADDSIARSKRLRSHALNEALAKGTVLTESADDGKPDGSAARQDESQNVAEHSTLFTVKARRVSTQLTGDYLTEQEDNQVREAQQIEQRTKVFIKIADRRLAALRATAPQPSDKNAQKKSEDEKHDWGV